MKIFFFWLSLNIQQLKIFDLNFLNLLQFQLIKILNFYYIIYLKNQKYTFFIKNNPNILAFTVDSEFFTKSTKNFYLVNEQIILNSNIFSFFNISSIILLCFTILTVFIIINRNFFFFKFFILYEIIFFIYIIFFFILINFNYSIELILYIFILISLAAIEIIFALSILLLKVKKHGIKFSLFSK